MIGTAQRALTKGQIFAYCIYATPLIATTAAISNFIPPYYSETFGLSLTLVAASLMAIRAIDAICDPFIGLAIDRARFRQKHRPWLLIALPLYLIAVTLLFMPIHALATPFYLILTGGAVYIAFTISMVVHQAWAASLTSDPPTLSRLFGHREQAVIAGILGVFGLAAIAGKLYGSDIAAQAKAAGVFILVAITICTFITYRFTPDRDNHQASHGAANWKTLRPFLLNRNFVLICLAMLVFNGAWTASATMAFFTAKYLYQAPQVFALGLTLSFAIAPLGMVMWMRLAARFGDRKILLVACLYLAAVMASLPIATRFGAPGLFALQALIGMGFGAGPYLMRSMTGVIANDYVVQSSSEVRGAAFATTNFFDKLGSGLGASALLPLAWLGFNPTATVGTQDGFSLLAVATGAPVLGFLLTALCIHLIRTDATRPALAH